MLDGGFQILAPSPVWAASAIKFYQPGLHRLIKAYPAGLCHGLLVGHGQGKRGGKCAHHIQKALFAVLKTQDKVRGFKDQPQLAGRIRRKIGVHIETVKHGRQHVQLFQQHGHGLLLHTRGLVLAARVAIKSQRLLQIRRDAQIVHDQAAGLVAVHAVHPGDGLHQGMALHGFVQIHGVQTGHVKAR